MTQETTVVEKVLCEATTQKGLPCKNHPQQRDTLCGPHRRMYGDEQPISPYMSPGLSAENHNTELDEMGKLFKSTAIGKSHNRHAEVGASINQLREEVDDLAQKVYGHAQDNPPTDKTPDIICISGSQDNQFPELTYAALDKTLDDMYPRPYIILGDAKGTDRLVASYLKEKGYKVEVVKAQWEDERGEFRPSAGMERNEQMIKRSAKLIAFNHEGFGNGEKGTQPVDKGTDQAIDKARAAGLPVRTFNLSQWESTASNDLVESALDQDYTQLAGDELSGGLIGFHQLEYAGDYEYRPSLITLNRPDWIYIGRGKAATAMQHPGMLAMPRMGIADFKRRIWQRMTSRDPHLLRELARISTRTAILCDCENVNTSSCHGRVVISSANFLHSDEGLKYRMTSQEIKDYDAAHNPALLATMDHPERTRIVARYGAMIQNIKPKVQPRQMDGSIKLSTAHPLVKNSRVIFVNGDIELPAIVTHIEYGDNWTDDAYTGRRRKEILNCTLVNEPTKAHFVYSDSNSEMIRRGHRANETGMPAESGLIPTIAPYIRKIKAVKEVTVTELTTNNRIKSGMPIRILDRATGAVMDVGIAKTINSAYWYNLTPQAPAIKDAWIVDYLSLLTNKSATWTGDEGTRIEPIN